MKNTNTDLPYNKIQYNNKTQVNDKQ